MVNRIEEKGVNYTRGRKAGVPAPKEKTLENIMKAGRRQANAAKRTAAETQEFLKWALQNCNNQGDLDAIRDLVNTHGTPKQRKLFAKMEYDLTHITGKKKAAISNLVESVRQHAEAKEAPASPAPVSEPVLGEKQKRRMEIAKQRAEKLANKENFRQALLNAESVEDLKALEKEYGKKFTGNLKSTYNARMHALEKAAAQQAAKHAEMQTVYNQLLGYGNGKHPSNTPLGTAQPTSSRGMTWAKYAQEHGRTYIKPEVSGVVQANRLAEEAIAQNIRHAELQAEYEKALRYGDGTKLHPSATPLGSAKPTASSGLTAEQLAQKLGREYVKPEVSGVVKADQIAEEIIERNRVTTIEPPKPPVIEPSAVEPPINNGGNGGKPPISKPPVAEPPINKPPKGKGFKLGKKGKFALAALAVGLISAGIVCLTKSKKSTPTTPSGEPIKPGLLPPDTTKTEKVDTAAITPIVADTTQSQKANAIAFNPISSSLLDEKVDTIEAQVVSKIPLDTETGKYVIRKGDNCWNIAKAELVKEKGGEIPSDKEVLERTYKIIERNDLHFEKDKYTVLIYPNDTLNIKI